MTDADEGGTTEIVCDLCDGGGQLTDDEFCTTIPQLLAEIERDERLNPRSVSRTRIAYESGLLKMSPCVECNGRGTITVKLP